MLWLTLALAGLHLSVAEGEPPRDAALGRTPSGHFTVEVMLDGRGPFPFIFDTAASHSAVLQSVAEGYGFQSTREELHDVQTLTEEIESERHPFGDVNLAGLDLGAMNAVIVVDPEDRSLPVAGLLGSDVLDGRRLTLDLGQARLTLGGQAPAHNDGRVDPVRQVLVGEARLARSRGRVKVLLDTGSARTIVNEALAQRLSHQNPTARMRVGSISRRAEAIDDARLARVSRLRIGGLCMPSFMAVNADVDVFRAMGWEDQPAMVLGLDVLQHAILHIDHAADTFEVGPAEGAAAVRCAGPRVQIVEES
jgi:predicted aspartyl protease